MLQACPNLARSLVVAGLCLLASGCNLQLSDFLTGSQSSGERDARQQAVSFAEALGLKAEDLKEVQASGILAKNSSKFSGTVTAPQGILAKNSSKYRVQAYSELPVGNAYVDLASPAGSVYTSGGRPAVGKTDAEGRFDFEFVLPAGTEVIVTVHPEATDYTLVNFTESVPGANAVSVDLASTYQTRYLVVQAMLQKKPMTGLDRGKFETIRGKTRAMLEAGDLSLTPTFLRFDQIRELNASYHAAMAARNPALLAAWQDLLGVPPANLATGTTKSNEEAQVETTGATPGN